MSKKLLTRRAIKDHCKDSLEYLDNLRTSGASQDMLAHVQDCHYQVTELLSRLSEESHSSRQSESPCPDGEYLSLIFILLTDLL